MTTLTPETRADIRAKAERATPGERIALVRTGRNPPPLPPEFVIIAATAPGHGIYANPPGGTYPAADMEFIAACDPQTIIHLLDASEPVAGGDLEQWKARAADLHLKWREAEDALWQFKNIPHHVQVLKAVADDIDCCPGCESGSSDPGTGVFECPKSHRGDDCPNDKANSLRELAGALLRASQAQPAAGGEFEAKLRGLVELTIKACTPDSPEAYRDNFERRDSLIAAISAAYARLQAENDKLKAALGYLERARQPFDPSCDDRTVELAVELTCAEEHVERLRGELAVMIALADQYVRSEHGRQAIAEARAALAGSAP